MAKPKGRKEEKPTYPVQQGPHLAAALIAEKILIERDDVPTIVRLVDRIGISPDAIRNLDEDNALGLPLWIMVSFRAGGYSGKSVLSLTQINPSGHSHPFGVGEMTFDGAMATRSTMMCPVVLKWDVPGEYWFDVFVNNEFISRIPLYVEIVGGNAIKKEVTNE